MDELQQIKHADGTTTYTRDFRSVTTSRNQQTYVDDQPCYLIHLRGDVGFFFGDSDAGILHSEDHEGGTNVWYVPQDGHFAEYAAELIRFGAWGE